VIKMAKTTDIERRIRQIGEISYLEISRGKHWGRYLPTYRYGRTRYIDTFTVAREEAIKAGFHPSYASALLDKDKLEIEMPYWSGNKFVQDFFNEVANHATFWRFNDRRVHIGPGHFQLIHVPTYSKRRQDNIQQNT